MYVFFGSFQFKGQGACICLKVSVLRGKGALRPRTFAISRASGFQHAHRAAGTEHSGLRDLELCA